MEEQHTYSICVLDKEYIKETLLLLHAAVNREEGHSNGTIKRFQTSLELLDELKLQIQKVY